MNFLYTFPAKIDHQPAGAALDWAGREPFHQTHALAENPALPFPLVMPNAFSPAECAAIVGLGEARVKRAASVDERSDLASRDFRVSEIAWIEPDADAQWLYHRLGVLFLQINASYGFDLLGFAEGLQYASYGPGQFFGWHADIGPGSTSLRKLSLTIQLSEADDYAGGALQFHGGSDMPAARALGAATFFPSYLAHQVAPVTRGLRRSLVAWGYGPAFR